MVPMTHGKLDHHKLMLWSLLGPGVSYWKQKYPIPLGWLTFWDHGVRNATCLVWAQPVAEIHPKVGVGNVHQLLLGPQWSVPESLDVDPFRLDICLHCRQTFIIHYIQSWSVPSCLEGWDNFIECHHHGSICTWGHGADNNRIEVIDVHHKYVLPAFKWADREGASDVGVHCPCDSIDKGSKTENFLYHS